MQQNAAVYPGTFDPFTNGHYKIVKQAFPLFDRITLAVAVNPEKPNAMFPLETRMGFLADIAFGGTTKFGPVLDVGSYTIKGSEALYTVDYAEHIGATHIIRGLRNNSDFESEYAMAQVNRKLNPRIRTVFFMADADFSAISSSMVRGLIGPKNWQEKVKEFIPSPMWERFITEVK